MKKLMSEDAKERRRKAVLDAKVFFGHLRRMPAGAIARRVKGKALSPTQFYKLKTDW